MKKLSNAQFLFESEDKMSESYIISGIALNGKARVMLADTTVLVEKARLTHDLYPTANAALGRTLSVGSLLAGKLKNEDEKINININGHGPLGTIMVEALKNGQIKGFVGDNTVYLKYNHNQKLAVGLAVGTDGYLQVTKYSGLKNTFTSRVALQSGEIGDDFAYYFTVSEQIPALVSVGVLVDTDYSTKAAGAMIIEMLPGHREEDIKYVEDLHLRPMSQMIAEGQKIEDIASSLFADFELLERRLIRYHCDCNKERFMQALLTLPQADLDEIMQDELIRIKCEYCNKEYLIKKTEMEAFIHG